MKRGLFLLLILLVATLFFNTKLVLAQDNTVSDAVNQVMPQILSIPTAKNEEQPVVPTEPGAPVDSETTQWLWGQIANLDIQNNELTLNYLDYEGDTEKQIVIGVDAKTKFENVKSLIDLKPQDAVSIDYVVDTNGKLVAKNINLEKPESAAATSEVAPVATPEASLPQAVNNEVNP